MKHLGIVATTSEGAALCFRVFCQQGTADLGPHDHPDVTMDCIALARSLPAWERADYQSVRATLSVSVHRLARAGSDFFVSSSLSALQQERLVSAPQVPGRPEHELRPGNLGWSPAQRVPAGDGGTAGTGHVQVRH